MQVIECPLWKKQLEQYYGQMQANGGNVQSNVRGVRSAVNASNFANRMKQGMTKTAGGFQKPTLDDGASIPHMRGSANGAPSQTPQNIGTMGPNGSG